MSHSRPHPLGLHLDGRGGAHAAVFAAHADAVEVCLLDADGGERRTSLPHRTDGVWHGRVEGVEAGQWYGLRVHGPWEPASGHRHNPSKLLLDPYARAVAGGIRWGQAVFGHLVDDAWGPKDGPAGHGGARWQDDTDNRGHAPVGVVLGDVAAPRTRRLDLPWETTVVYEAHLRGLTMRHPDVPEELRGTWAGLAHPAVVEHLAGLGVTALELLPVFAVGDEPALVRRGMRNYWGYNHLSFFAPEPRYASAAARAAGPSAVVAEVVGAVDALHEAGLEVWLDVVYNHTCEAGGDGPTFSWRGVDNASYYRLDEHGNDLDVTGCGNTVDFSHPRVVAMALDSLRHWVQAYGIDGFRFDLAPALARGDSRRGADSYKPDHPFLVAARADPLLQTVKLVAEPWDVGTHGWRTGQFPPPFAEWNDRFRDGVRSFWLSDAAHALGAVDGHPRSDLRDLATRLAGSSDHFATAASADRVGRSAWASVNFVSAHDGYTLADTTAYERKHNEANGEGNRDGHGDNRSWNHGVEGTTDDAGVLRARHASGMALLSTLLLSTGTPMLLGGDELARSQGGNNNPYCLDDETTWVSWDLDDVSRSTLEGTRTLLRLRRELAPLRQAERPSGRAVHPDGTTDLAWFAPDGSRMDHDRWHDPSLRTLQMFLHAHEADETSVLVVVQGHHGDVEVTLPGEPWAERWEPLWDSASHAASAFGVEAAGLEPVDGGGTVVLGPRTVRLYRG